MPFNLRRYLTLLILAIVFTVTILALCGITPGQLPVIGIALIFHKTGSNGSKSTSNGLFTQGLLHSTRRTQQLCRYDTLLDKSCLESFEGRFLFYRVNITDVQRRAVKGNIGDYLSEYKNPCWVERVEGSHGNKLLQATRLRCLPYFYVVGVTKSGTSDLRHVMGQHPDIMLPAKREPMYWHRARLRGIRKFDDYVNLFQLTPSFRNRSSCNRTGSAITFDSSPSYLWDFSEWRRIPATSGMYEPPFTVANSLYALAPQTKIIATLRNPVDRLYSHYNHFRGRSARPAEFHRLVLLSVAGMRRCLGRYSPRICVYNPELSNEQSPVFLRASMYYFFILDWLRVFPRSQVFIQKAEDYYSNREIHLEKIFDFLGVAPLSQQAYRSLQKLKPRNARTYPGMRNVTRDLLQAFYRPYNRLLVELLADQRFAYSKH